MKMNRLSLFRILVAVFALSCGTGALAARHALLIGIADYQGSGLRPLPGTLNDVAMMENVLLSRFGFQKDEITVLKDRQATHTGIQQAFAELEREVQPGDWVYVHYSGHGSLVKDFNDSERNGWDQTLVSYGARHETSEGLDRYDILDDELNQWLGPIADKAGELIFVADACHSASNTRGSEVVFRSGPKADQADHPHAHDVTERHPLTGAVLIGAARDDQSAHEVEVELDGESSKGGLFTWHWARALRQAEPTDTWRRLFERAGLWVSLSHGVSQQPQISGTGADRQIVGGGLDLRPPLLVSDVRGNTVTLNAGRLAGVTVGSLYAASDSDDASRVRISETYMSWSRGDIDHGEVAVGDFLIEREHAYETAPMMLFALASSDARDEALNERLRDRLGGLPGFVWGDAQENADLVLAVLRPQRDDHDTPEYKETPEGRNTLPETDSSATPEVWVLTPGERLLHERLAIRLDTPEQGLDILAKNLERYRRAVDLRRLTAEGGSAGDIVLSLLPYETCTGSLPGCFEVPDTKTWHRPASDSLPIEALGERDWPAGTLVSFVLENTGHRDRYVYLFELSPDGAIKAVFPSKSMSTAQAQIKAGKRLELPDEDIGLMLDTPGDVSLLVLATQFSIDPRRLEQTAFTGDHAETRGAANPLERLLADTVQGPKTRSGVSMGTGTWGGSMIDYRVEAEEVTSPKN